MPPITADVLKLYLNHNGNDDMLLRVGSEDEKALLYGPGWGLINSAMQDMDLISKKLASKSFTELTLSQLKENCDEWAFNTLTGRISFYIDFQKIADIHILIEQKINTTTDIAYTRFNSVNELENSISKVILGLHACDFDSLAESERYFSPTGLYQELAIDNGWPDEYMILAAQFDLLKNKIYTGLNDKE